MKCHWACFLSFIFYFFFSFGVVVVLGNGWHDTPALFWLWLAVTSLLGDATDNIFFTRKRDLEIGKKKKQDFSNTFWVLESEKGWEILVWNVDGGVWRWSDTSSGERWREPDNRWAATNFFPFFWGGGGEWKSFIPSHSISNIRERRGEIVYLWSFTRFSQWKST